MAKVADGISVLDQMAGGIVARKAAAAKGTLTPVAGETQSIHTAGVLPNDLPGVFMSNEVLADAERTLRAKAQVLIEVADAIHVLTGDVFGLTDGAATPAKVAKSLERFEGTDPEPKANEPADFATAFAAKQAAAQAAVFTPGTALANMVAPVDDTENEDPPETPAVAAALAAAAAGGGPAEVMEAAMAAGGWVCPTHGKTKVKKSAKGREYNGCPVEPCGEYERL